MNNKQIISLSFLISISLSLSPHINHPLNHTTSRHSPPWPQTRHNPSKIPIHHQCHSLWAKSKPSLGIQPKSIAKSKPKIHSKIKTQSTDLATHLHRCHTHADLIETHIDLHCCQNPWPASIKTHDLDHRQNPRWPTPTSVINPPPPERDREIHNH